jgi:hypothetical protein
MESSFKSPDGYNPKSCNALEKPFYHPIEAAIRWCGLIAYEPQILANLDASGIPKICQFPQWPCLRENAQKIMDAIENGELPYGRDGKYVRKGEHVAPHRLTVRHTDLKAWMAKHYPGQKPAFLFDETERTTHAAINADAFRALQVERDALRAEREQALKWAHETLQEMEALRSERDSLRTRVERSATPGERSETTYLNIIGGLLELLLGKTPAGRPQSVFNSQASIVEALTARYPDKHGLSKRTLDDKFAKARQSLKAS